MNALLMTATSDAVLAYVNALISGAGSAAAEAAAKGKLASTAGGLVDKRWAKLASRLSEFAVEDAKDPDDEDIELIDAKTGHGATAAGWDWTLGATAGLALDIDVLTDKQLEELGISPQENTSFVAWAVQAQLGASVKGTQAKGAWALSANAAAGIKARLEWYTAAATSSRLGEAFIAAAPLFVPPMSLPDLFDAAAMHPDFWGCSTQIDGTLSAGFAAKANWSATGWTLGLNGDKPQIGLSFGVEGSASIKLDGKFRLRCVPVKRGSSFVLRVRLDNLDVKEKSLGLAISAGVDFSAVAKSAQAFLEAKLAPVNKDLADLLANPGAAIGKKLEGSLAKLLKGTALKDLAPLLAGTGDKSAAADALAAKLAGPLADRLDQLSGEIAGGSAKAEALIEKFVAQAFGKVPLSPDVAAAVKSFLTEALGDAKSKLDAAIDKLAADLDGKTQAAAAKLLEPLGAVGEKIGEAVKQLGSSIAKAPAIVAIGDGLKEYGALRKRLITAFSDAQRARVTARLSLAIQESRSRQTMLELDILNGNDAAAQRLFAALWSGGLEDLGGLIEAAEASAAVADVSGWLQLVSKRVQKETFSLSALGFDFINSTVRTTELTVRSDLAGNLLVFAGTADATAETINHWVQRRTSLGIAVRMSDGEASATQRGCAIEFSGTFSARGKDLDDEQFALLQRSLAVVTGQRDPVDLRRLLGTPAGDDFRAIWRRAAFLLPMSLAASEFAAIGSQSDDEVQLTMLDCALRAMDGSLDHGEGFGEDDPRPSALVRALAKEVRNDSSTRGVLLYLAAFPRGRTSKSSLAQTAVTSLGFPENMQVQGSLSGMSTPAHRKLWSLHRLANAVNDAVVFARACRMLEAEVQQAIVRRLDRAGIEALTERSQRHLRTATDALAGFAIASETLVGNKEPVPWPLVAFSWMLCRLARGEATRGFTPMITFDDRPGQPVPLLT